MRIAALLSILALAACGDDATTSPDSGRPRMDASVMDAGSTDAAAIDAGTDARGPSDANTDATTTDAALPSRFDDLLARFEDPAATEVELDAIVHDVAWNEGWPLRDGDRWLFATRWDGAPAEVAVVGDVNGWDPGRWLATRHADGVHFFRVVDGSGFDVPADGSKYKWHGTGDVFRAPPEATAYGFDEFGEFGWVRPDRTARWLERFPALDSAHLDDVRTVRVLLPAGFTRGAAVRTLLLHDGQNVFHPDAPWGGWRVDEALAATGYEDVLAVSVDNAPDRFDAYTHVVDTVSGLGTVGGRADDYLSLLREEVLPFARSRYAIVAGGSSLMIMGSSLGGLVTLYGAMIDDGLAGCVAAMSSTLGWGAFGPGASEALVSRWSTERGHGSTAIYLDSGGDVTGACGDGDGDGVFEDSDDFDNYCTTLQLRDTLDGLGYTFDTDLFHWWEPGAPHNESAWADRVPRALSACTTAGWSAE